MNKRIVLIRSNPVKPYPRLEKMADCLLELGYGITVLAWDRDSNYSPKTEQLKLVSGDVPIIRIGIKGQFSGGFKKNLKGLLKFQQFIRSWLISHKDNYDIIHAYDFDTGFTAQKVAKKLNKLFIYDIADYYVESHGLNGLLGKTVKKFENRVINNSDATIICTDERKEQIKDSQPKILEVIHNTPNLQVAEKIDYEKSKKLRLVYVGILGTARFIDKIAQIISERDDCEFHIGGYGNNMETFFEDLSRKYNNIFYYGRIDYKKTLELEQTCDVMCAMYDPTVPNHVYAAPNKFYEALALGKPLIMAKGTGMSTVVERNNIGLVVDYNSESFSDALTWFVNNRSSIPAMEDRAKALYEEIYSWENMKNKIKQLYARINNDSEEQ